MPGRMRFSVPLRLPLRLEGHSVLTRLLRHGSYVVPPEAFVYHMHLEVLRALRADAGELARDTLHVSRSDGTVIPLSVDLRNTQFIAADQSSGVYADGYEPDIMALLDIFVGDQGTFLDIGANWGFFALQLALRPNFAGRIVAFEPGAQPRRDLEALVAACELGTVVSVRPEALGDVTGPHVLTSHDFSGNASIAVEGPGEVVACARLDDLDLPAASLIKLDVEGSEGAVLRGALRYLAAHAPAVVFECRTDTPGGAWTDPFDVLAEAGYVTYALATRSETDPAGARRIMLEATPMRAQDRTAWPDHLNVLALKDAWAHLPHRV